jgi:hypothetical protein
VRRRGEQISVIGSEREGPTTIRSSGVARRISPRVIQHPKAVKESWPSIETGHVARDQHYIDSQVGKSNRRSEKLAKSEFSKERSGSLDRGLTWAVDRTRTETQSLEVQRGDLGRRISEHRGSLIW